MAHYKITDDGGMGGTVFGGGSGVSGVTQGPMPDPKPEWSEWRKTSSYIPRKSFYGKWIIGPMYKRGKWVDDISHRRSVRLRRKRVRQYISKKELFKWKLANGKALHSEV